MVVGCGEHGKRVKEYEGEVELVDHAFVPFKVLSYAVKSIESI